MAKQKKKRNKAYRGNDAKAAPTKVIRFEAANRGKLGQWWFEKKRIVKPVAIAAAVLIVLVVLVIEIIRLAL